MDLMSLSARELSNKCLEAFQICSTFRSVDPGLSNQNVAHDERFEYRLADFNLWIDGIGALAPSKASLDARLSERPIDLSLVKGNLVMLFQSLEDCLDLLKDNEPLEDVLLDIDSALESLVTLSLAIRRTGRRSRLHKADRLFKPEEHAELRKHLEAIILLRPGPGPCCRDNKFRIQMKPLTPLQNHLVIANLKRRNRFIQAQLHSLGLKKRSIGFELPPPEIAEQHAASAPSPENRIGVIDMPTPASSPQPTNRPLPAPISVTSASVPEKAKNNNRWRKHLAEDIRPYTCIFDRCPAPDVYYSSRSMLEQHFRQDHPPVWVCPLCDDGSVYPTMTEMMDHLHDVHVQDAGDDISSIISSSAQKRMGVESCPLCEVKGDTDSPELIDHVLEHVHDFSLRSLPWPRSSEVDIGGEVGSFNPQRGEVVSITRWLDGYEHETEDIDPLLKLSSCDYGRLAIITEQMRSEGEDKLGLDIGFADEHGDESAEAETDISQLTQSTIESANEPPDTRCSDCLTEWYRDEIGLRCPKCQSDRTETVGSLLSPCPSHNTNKSKRIGPKNDGRSVYFTSAGAPLQESRPSITSARESTSGFRWLTDRFLPRKKSENIEPDQDKDATKSLTKFLDFKHMAVEDQMAWKILINVFHRRLDSPTKTQSMFENFIRDVQKQGSLPTIQPVNDHHSFLQVMVKFYLDPLKRLPPKDLKKPMSNYFINSSHRTLLHTFTRSRDAYYAIREVLYFGHRSIDLDVWNGEKERDLEREQPPEAKPGQTLKILNGLFRLNRSTNAQKPVDPRTNVSQSGHIGSPTEPIVTDGSILMTPCGFREACQVIRKSAFVSTDLPVIVSLEVHADSGQQELMVKIMKEEWRDILVDKPLEGCDTRFCLPTLEDLRGRILVRLGTITSPSVPNSGEPDNDLTGERLHKPGHLSIIQSLADLGVYLRREKFEGFRYKQTKSPTHLFSMPENESIRVQRDKALQI
ncbi:1-phosphatidylinositol-4 5-bisphosphate phosphodiesterase [Fusarium mundagurra]|uniref:1-phosphatidylinositol-4 5-bisphosphate phosphodiesterase n=1 Tax=Fusarium mundagurra TaxID=1567541 RepID=A0A8H5Z123_9HYPO|nr:1-phosphatidylinositol-4 5-bisphosphate phosphodiesterase [Fusarium mundagurra]